MKGLTMSDQAWHSRTVAEAYATLGTDAAGLTGEEAALRLARFGPNELKPSIPASALSILIDQVTSVVVLLLAVAAVISWMLGDFIEAAAIAGVLIINTGIGFIIDLRARRAMEALLHFQVPHAAVVRAGHTAIVEARKLVPGDIIELNAGQMVPADARVVATHELRTLEAALTGESLPISKHADAVVSGNTGLAERVTMIYKGTTVAAGTGRAAVTATGAATEIGRIGTLVNSIADEKTPLERRLDALGHRLVWFALGVAALVAGLGAWQGAPLGLVIELGIALAVAAVPEGLPAVATIALAIGLRRMAKRHALVRRLPAVEALGSTTVVCTDKTRTLTSGNMTVVRVWTADVDHALSSDGTASAEPVDVRVRRALEVGVLASRPSRAGTAAAVGVPSDPVDAAVVGAALRAGVAPEIIEKAHEPVGLVPFSSERKLMAAFYLEDGRVRANVKGAPRRLLELSTRVLTSAADGRVTERLLDAGERERLSAVNAAFAGAGLRVLALANGAVASPDELALGGLTFVGLIGIMDPPAPGVKDTIARLRVAGLRTIMLTGDQRLTGEAIGRELGLMTGDLQAIEGRTLQTLSGDALADTIERTAVFSRVSPEDKLTIVRALQQRGEIVAMLGDGVNDAAALRKADVGVAMGIRGTEVAKEAASIVLQDDRFETIAAAVEEGRVVFDNIRKFVFYLFTCNLAEILVLLVAGLAGMPLPLLPLQLLWLNMVTDTFPALALAIEPGDPDVMQRPPRDPREAMLSRQFLVTVAGYAVLIAGSTLAALIWARRHAPDDMMTMVFMTLALAQIFHLGNARSSGPVLRFATATANPAAIAAVVLSVALQLVAVSVEPIASILRVAPLGLREWTVVLALSITPAVAGQVLKEGHRWRHRVSDPHERG
jgi:P-type Ca2+ transporter type 2C